MKADRRETPTEQSRYWVNWRLTKEVYRCEKCSWVENDFVSTKRERFRCLKEDFATRKTATCDQWTNLPVRIPR